MISEEKTFLASIGKEYPFPYFCPPGRSEIACWEVSQTLYENEERKTMNGRKRTVQVKFYVTEEERSLIEEKMKLVPTNNMAAYLRKIAIDGYIIQVDHTDIKAMTAEIQKIGVNVNQIARRVNATGNACKEDIEEIKGGACGNMAVTKIKPVKSTLSKALDYIENPDKTDGKMLVSSFGCSYETADIEFEYTLSQALQKGNNLAFHLIQSFEPGEVDYQKAHEIGKQLADAVTKGQHEYVLTTHIDKGHVHNHIIFCAVNFVDHRKYNSNKRSYYGIRNMSDKLCRENGLSVVVPGKGSKGKSYAEYQAEKTGTSWKGKLKIAVDALIPQVSSFEELLQRLQAAGYEIKPGKYVSCRAPGQERFTRLKTLGADYTEEAIRERIAGRRAKAAKAPREQRGVSLLIDIENSIKAAQSKGYEQWAKIHNLKQAAKTMNFLTEHKIEQYADLVSRIEEMAAESGQAADALKDAEKRLADMAVLIKNVSTYQKTKPVYDAYRKARNREKYRAGQEQAIILHEAAARSLKAAGIAKLPNLAALQSEYEALQAQKEALYADYGKLKKKVREYDIIKQNIDSILQADRQPEREKGTERG